MEFKPKQDPKKEILIQFKVNQTELRAIKANAAEWSDGNMSGWIRYAAICLKPKRNHLTKPSTKVPENL